MSRQAEAHIIDPAHQGWTPRILSNTALLGLPAAICLCGLTVTVLAGWFACTTDQAERAASPLGVPLVFLGALIVCLGFAAGVLGRRYSARSSQTERAATYLRVASEGAEIGFWDRDLRTGALEWDQTMHRIYGTDPERTEPTSALWASLVHPADIAETADLFDRTIQGLGNFSTMFRIVTPAGEARTVRTAATVIHDRHGAPIRVVGANWNVTELSDATEELSRTATRLSLAMRSAKIGLWDLDLTTREAHCDATFHTLFGYEPDELNGPDVDWHSLCHPEDLSPMRSECLAYLHNLSGSFRKDYRLRTKAGDWVWVHDAGEVVERDALGNPTRMVGVRMLIDEQKRSGDALRSVVALTNSSSEGGLLSQIARSLAESFDLMFVSVSRYKNDGPEQQAEILGGWYLGKEMEPFTYQIRGTPCEVAGADGYHCVKSGVQALYPEDRDLVEMGGESYAGVQILDSRGEPIGILNVINDTPLRGDIDLESVLRLLAARAAVEIERNEIETELRDAKAEAERASAFKSEFLANVSHEIRTPIAAMIGYADILTETAQVDERTIAEHAGTISRNGNQLLTLVNDLLDTSKIDAGQMRVEWISACPAEIVRDVEALLRPRIEEKGLDFSIVCSTDIPSAITTDPARLRQILVNLLGNAAKFTEAGSVTLRVTYDQTCGLMRFSVEDTGIGIAEQDTPGIFRPFVQAEASTTRRFGGTGLGLSISRQLARLLGGDITMRSTPGEGSVFCASVTAAALGGAHMLPASAFEMMCRTAAQTAKPVGPDRPALQGVRVLLVEDSLDNRRLLRHHLERIGGDVSVAVNGQEALAMIGASEPFELIVTDMQMPVMDGYELVRTLRARGSGIPVIALTAHATTDDEVRCLEAGCDVYETKPVSRERLVTACAHAMRRARQRPAA